MLTVLRAPPLHPPHPSFLPSEHKSKTEVCLALPQPRLKRTNQPTDQANELFRNQSRPLTPRGTVIPTGYMQVNSTEFTLFQISSQCRKEEPQSKQSENHRQMWLCWRVWTNGKNTSSLYLLLVEVEGCVAWDWMVVQSAWLGV